jgi:hypothetical protein
MPYTRVHKELQRHNQQFSEVSKAVLARLYIITSYLSSTILHAPVLVLAAMLHSICVHY